MDLLKGNREAENSKGVLCASVREGTPTLVVIPSVGNQLILPWIHFLYARYEDLHEFEQIQLFYSSHKVQLHGIRLKELVKHFSSYRVEWVRSYDRKYSELCPKDLPFVSKIKVEEKLQ